MTTRAIQIDLLLAGIINPTTGEAVGSGTVYFYSAGTLDAKSVWTEKEKTNAYSSYSLSGVGTAQLYGEGNYKFVVKDSNGTTVLTLDNIRLEFPYYGIRSITQTGAHSQLSQDDFLLIDTTSGAVTINALAAASWTRPLKIQRIAGTNNITFDPSGSETVDGSATLVISSNAIVEIISDGSNLRSAGFRSSFADTDNDTKIQVEESADEDKIRFDCGGTEKALLSGTATESYAQINSHQDADGDTKIQVEESSDEDVIRLDIGGSEAVQVAAQGILLPIAGYGIYKTISNSYLLVGGGQDSTDGGTIELYGSSHSTQPGAIILKASNNNRVHISSSGYVGIGKVAGTSLLDVNGAVEGTSLVVGGVAITATPAEINSGVDGLTATAAEINAACDGVPSRSYNTATGLTIASTLTELVDLDLGTLTVGDIVFISVYVTGTKGGTAGDVIVYPAQKSGTGTVTFHGGISNPSQRVYPSSGDPISIQYTVPMYVSGSGTVVLKAEGQSSGSDTGSTNAHITAITVKKQ